jgi:hypothetical protein
MMNPPMSSANMAKMKKQGCPMDSVESVEAWRRSHQNIAQRKPDVRPPQPPVAVPSAPAQAAKSVYLDSDAFPPMTRANEVRHDGTPMGEGFDEARTREKIATANLAEIEEAALRGTYLVKADFERHLFNAGRMLRDTLTNCARRIGAEVSGLTTAEECEAVIDREHRAALASFAQQLRHTLKVEVEANPLDSQ